LHFGAFNVKTGEAVQAPCFTALRTYKVVVQDGQVMVDLDKTAGRLGHVLSYLKPAR
jgi:hypothetical protein